MKTLIFRNLNNTTRIDIQVDLFATNEELLMEGFDASFTAMDILGDKDTAAQLGIGIGEKVTSYKTVLNRAKEIGLGLYVIDSTFQNIAASDHLETLSFKGTSGEVDIKINGITFTATFSTSIFLTAKNFLNTVETDLLALGMVMNLVGDDCTFELDTNGILIEVLPTTSGDLTATTKSTRMFQSGNGEVTLVPAIS